MAECIAVVLAAGKGTRVWPYGELRQKCAIPIAGGPMIAHLVGANASYIGDYSRTGVNAILLPGVKVGCYSCIGPGVILYDDVPSRKLVLAKQEHEVREWGPERYGW